MGFFCKDAYIPVPLFHDEILRLYESDHRLVCVLAPVGFAKSTTLRSYAIKSLLSGIKYQLYVSSTASKVVQHFTSFAKFFGSPDFQKFFFFFLLKINTDQVIIAIDGDIRCIQGVSAGSDISGINFEGQRPEIINIDDLEELEQANSISRTNKLLDWLETTLLSRLPSLNTGKVRMIGTNLSLTSLINRIMLNKIQGWHTVRYEALNQDNQSIWEERHPAKALIELRDRNPTVFARNYQNSPLDGTSALIQASDVMYYDYLDMSKFEKIYIHADTTHTAKTTSDYFCLIALGEHIDNHNYYVIDLVMDKIDPEQQARALIAVYNRLEGKVKKITFDEKANQGFGHWTRELAKREYNLSLPLLELKYNGDKINHFEPHIPHFRSRRVYLPRKHKMLDIALSQLLAFPSKSVNDDFVDGLSGVLDNFLKKPRFVFATEI